MKDKSLTIRIDEETGNTFSDMCTKMKLSKSSVVQMLIMSFIKDPTILSSYFVNGSVIPEEK